MEAFLNSMTPEELSSLPPLSDQELQNILDTLSPLPEAAQSPSPAVSPLQLPSPTNIQLQSLSQTLPSLWSEEEEKVMNAKITIVNQWLKSHPTYTEDQAAKLKAERRHRLSQLYLARHRARKRGQPLPPLPNKRKNPLIRIDPSLGFAPESSGIHVLPQQRRRPISRIPHSVKQHIHNGQTGIETDKIGKL